MQGSKLFSECSAKNIATARAGNEQRVAPVVGKMGGSHTAVRQCQKTDILIWKWRQGDKPFDFCACLRNTGRIWRAGSVRFKCSSGITFHSLADDDELLKKTVDDV